ncbi:hypothetical protein KGI01_10530 [Kurthia gibsonii]|nr:hypothetical protein KGI01_10530 [Kurthia gibsonii]
MFANNPTKRRIDKKRIREDLVNELGVELKSLKIDRSQFKVLEKSNVEKNIDCQKLEISKT